jgi:hypothetical protein
MITTRGPASRLHGPAMRLADGTGEEKRCGAGSDHDPGVRRCAGGC